MDIAQRYPPFKSVRRLLLATATEMLAGSIDLISGCRELNRLRIYADLDMSEVFGVIETVEAETDRYPIGAARTQYSPELLSRLDTWATACLERARPSIREACAALIREYEMDPSVSKGEKSDLL